MGKRFTATEKWSRAWFRELPPAYKLLVLYLYDNCDAGGIWYVDKGEAEFKIGAPIDLDAGFDMMKGRVVKVCGGKRWFIVDFIQFQYMVPIENLNPKNMAHRGALKALREAGIALSLKQVSELESGKIMPDPSKPLQSPLEGASKLPRIRNRNSEKGGGGGGGFDEFWKEYPNKKSRALAAKCWEKLNPDAALFATIMAALGKHKRCDQWVKDGGQFVPHPSTWLNQRRWEDEVREASGGKVVGDSKPIAGKYDHLGGHGSDN